MGLQPAFLDLRSAFRVDVGARRGLLVAELELVLAFVIDVASDLAMRNRTVEGLLRHVAVWPCAANVRLRGFATQVVGARSRGYVPCHQTASHVLDLELAPVRSFTLAFELSP